MEELIFILRNLIGDTNSTKYTDDSLLNLLCTAAFLVITETPFIEGYTVNLKDKTITPDPTYANVSDIPFMTLISLKASYLILNSEAKISSAKNVKIHDGPSIIDLKDQWMAINELAKARKEEYDYIKNKLTLEYNSGNCLVVMSPTTVQTIYDNGWVR